MDKNKGKNEFYLSGNERGYFLSSGFQSPFSEENFVNQLRVASLFQSYATGGSILHIFLGEPITKEQKIKLIDRITKFPVQYFSITPTLVICNTCGKKDVAKRTICSKCGGKDVSIWSRPIGYFRPAVRGNVSINGMVAGDYMFWSEGRLVDLAKRKLFMVDDLYKL